MQRRPTAYSNQCELESASPARCRLWCRLGPFVCSSCSCVTCVGVANSVAPPPMKIVAHRQLLTVAHRKFSTCNSCVRRCASTFTSRNSNHQHSAGFHQHPYPAGAAAAGLLQLQACCRLLPAAALLKKRSAARDRVSIMVDSLRWSPAARVSTAAAELSWLNLVLSKYVPRLGTRVYTAWHI